MGARVRIYLNLRATQFSDTTSVTSSICSGITSRTLRQPERAPVFGHYASIDPSMPSGTSRARRREGTSVGKEPKAFLDRNESPLRHLSCCQQRTRVEGRF